MVFSLFLFLVLSFFFSPAYLNTAHIPTEARGLLAEELWHELLHGESGVCADDYDDKVAEETITFLKKAVNKLWATHNVAYIKQNAYEFCHHVATLLKPDDVDRSLKWFRYCAKPSPPCADIDTNDTAISKFHTLYVH